MNLQVVFDAFFKTIKSIYSVIIVGAVLVLILGVIGVNLLKGRLYSCTVSESITT